MSEHLSEPSGRRLEAVPGDLEALALAGSPVITYVASAAGRRELSYVSANVERLTGHRADALRAGPLVAPAWIPAGDAAALEHCLETLAPGARATLEHRLLTAQGEHLWVRHDVQLAADDAGVPRLAGSLLDITAHKQVEAELERTGAERDRLDQLLRDAIEGLPDAFSIVEGHPLPVWMVDNDTAEILYVSPAAARLMGHEWPSSIPGRTTDHMANVAERGPYNARLREAGEIRDHEMQFRKADGTLFWASMNERLVNYQGREVSITSFVDLTERKRVEQALRESEALVRRVLEACPVPATMARAEDGSILYVSPATHAMFGETAEVHATRTIDYYVDPEDRAGYVAALRAEGAGERRVRVATRVTGVCGEIQVEVADSGPGMSPEVRSRMFEPFFTTKEEGVGTGIGLALCHRIIQTHRGRIRVDTPPGGGTAIRFTLPRPEAPGTQRAERGERKHANDTLSVLVVDDEPDVAQVLASILALDGHETALAASGREALAQLETRDFNLILSDLRMPDLDGPGLYQALAERDRSLLGRVAFVTGDTVSPKARHLLDSAGCPCLEKPVTPAMLRAFVDDFRDGRQ